MKENSMFPTNTRSSNAQWMRTCVLLLLALLLAACGGDEAADTPQEQQAAAVETEAEAATGATVCVVPDVVGFDQANAERMIQGVGLVTVRNAEFSAEVPEGQVVAQEPPIRMKLSTLLWHPNAQ
jgi:hypothetical protein